MEVVGGQLRVEPEVGVGDRGEEMRRGEWRIGAVRVPRD